MNRLQYVFIIFFCGYMIPAHAFFRSFISMLYNTSQYASARFKKTMGAETAYAWARKIVQKESSAHVPQSPKLNYAAMHKEIAADNESHNMTPLKANFSFTSTLYAQCKKNNPACMGMVKLLQDPTWMKTPHAAGPLTLNTVKIHVQEDTNTTDSIKVDAKINATGSLKCPNNTMRCNQELYLLSKCSKDLSHCIVQQSEQKPTSTKCATLFSMLTMNVPTMPADQEIKVKDFKLDITLDDPEASSSWL